MEEREIFTGRVHRNDEGVKETIEEQRAIGGLFAALEKLGGERFQSLEFLAGKVLRNGGFETMPVTLSIEHRLGKDRFVGFDDSELIERYEFQERTGRARLKLAADADGAPDELAGERQLVVDRAIGPDGEDLLRIRRAEAEVVAFGGAGERDGFDFVLELDLLADLIRDGGSIGRVLGEGGGGKQEYQQEQEGKSEGLHEINASHAGWPGKWWARMEDRGW